MFTNELSITTNESTNIQKSTISANEPNIKPIVPTNNMNHNSTNFYTIIFIGLLIMYLLFDILFYCFTKYIKLECLLKSYLYDRWPFAMIVTVNVIILIILMRINILNNIYVVEILFLLLILFMIVLIIDIFKTIIYDCYYHNIRNTNKILQIKYSEYKNDGLNKYIKQLVNNTTNESNIFVTLNINIKNMTVDNTTMQDSYIKLIDYMEELVFQKRNITIGYEDLLNPEFFPNLKKIHIIAMICLIGFFCLFIFCLINLNITNNHNNMEDSNNNNFNNYDLNNDNTNTNNLNNGSYDTNNVNINNKTNKEIT